MSGSFVIRVSTLACFLLLLSLSFACQSTSDTRAADEAALRKLDDEWSKAAGSRDVHGAVVRAVCRDNRGGYGAQARAACGENSSAFQSFPAAPSSPARRIASQFSTVEKYTGTIRFNAGISALLPTAASSGR